MQTGDVLGGLIGYLRHVNLLERTRKPAYEWYGDISTDNSCSRRMSVKIVGEDVKPAKVHIGLITIDHS